MGATLDKELKKRAEHFAQYDVPMPQDMMTSKWQQGRFEGYVAGATEQDALSYLRGRNDTLAEMNELCQSGEASDGYHTFNELYNFRREYNAALVNSGVWKAHKSHRHHSGELCFGGGWFIVMMDTPYGQISNHYQDEYWEEFNCEEREFADEWDGHTEKDVLNRLRACNTDHCRKMED